MGRPALLDDAGDGRRAEPDRRHEQPGPRVHRRRSRSASTVSARRSSRPRFASGRAGPRALRDQTIAFRGPVVDVHGDSHYVRIDKPLENSAVQRLENFTRLETFGDHQENGNNDVNWVKVLVDPGSREVFSSQEEIVPGNRTVVPSP